MVVTRNCKVCGSDQVEELEKNNFALIDQIDLSYNIAGCNKCGYVFANRLPDQDTYQFYYSKLTKYGSYDSLDKIPAIDLEIANDAVTFLKDAGIKFNSVFDIGCSIGLILNEIKKRNAAIKCHGIDPSPKSKENAKSLFGLDIETGFFDRKTDLKGYDLVVSSCVLEHLFDPHSMMEGVVANINVGTQLMLVVPSLNDFPATVGEWLGELSIEHINFFNERSLEVLLNQTGFEDIKWHRKKLANGQFALYLIAKYSGKKPKDVEQRDATGVASMQDYLERGNKEVARIEDLILSIPGEYILFGGGSHSLRLLARKKLQNKLPKKILDSNTNLHGRKIAGVAVVAPAIQNLEHNVPVVISSYRGAQSIKQLLSKLGFAGPTVELY